MPRAVTTIPTSTFFHDDLFALYKSGTPIALPEVKGSIAGDLPLPVGCIQDFWRYMASQVQEISYLSCPKLCWIAEKRKRLAIEALLNTACIHRLQDAGHGSSLYTIISALFLETRSHLQRSWPT